MSCFGTEDTVRVSVCGVPYTMFTPRLTSVPLQSLLLSWSDIRAQATAVSLEKYLVTVEDPPVPQSQLSPSPPVTVKPAPGLGSPTTRVPVSSPVPQNGSHLSPGHSATSS